VQHAPQRGLERAPCPVETEAFHAALAALHRK
jgi:hypothetical protein